jgi:aryl-alcohol dehydrogenase-like predicted oxidoreductase
MSITGHATLEGTARYRERLQETIAANHFRLEQNLWLSSLGIGTYLGKPDAETDERYTEAVTRAVTLGANVIDTAANYRFQRSERSIGAALSALIEGDSPADTFARDEIVVCTKGGYIPFDTTPPAGQEGVRRYIEETFIKPGIADFADIAAGSHCMTPKYLAHQIDQSRRNLNLATIDVYYIHNPESQLGVVSRAEFETRLRAAFKQLERSVADGLIKNYGVATWNGFRVAPQAQGFHSLERMSELAREVGGAQHHFRFIQLPLNLAMPEALTLSNQTFQGAQVSLLEAARALEVTVVASASILQGKVARGLSPEIREPLGSLASDALTAIQFTRSTPGITTALVGMSRRAHVEENLQLARIEPARPEQYQQLFSTGAE